MEQSINQEPRSSPFILIIGSTVHIILEGRPFLRVETTAEGIIALLATYYVFHLKYNEKVQNALLFLQSFVLGERDIVTESCAAVHSFTTLVEKMRSSTETASKK